MRCQKILPLVDKFFNRVNKTEKYIQCENLLRLCKKKKKLNILHIKELMKKSNQSEFFKLRTKQSKHTQK